jgi:hypothetical protein
MGWTAGVRLLEGTGGFSLLHSVQTGSGAHPDSYPMITSPGVKRPECEADHSPTSGTEVKYGGAIPPLSVRLHGVALN